MAFYKIWIISLIVGVVKSSIYSSSIKDYCIGEKFSATCDHGSVVTMTHATFGSMSTGRCAQAAYQYCEENIIGYADYKCSGKQECQFAVTSILDDVEPCANVLPTMQGSFECIKIRPASTEECYQHQMIIVTEASGNLSSMTADNGNAGSNDCPWRIQAPKGKKILLTMIDFGIWSRRMMSSVTCERYGTITEHESGEQIPICGGNNRIESIYMSKTSTLDIAIRSSNEYRFLLKYEAVGCLKYTSPGTHVALDDITATVTCLATGATWKMKCEGSEWTGSKLRCDGDSMSDFIFGEEWKTSHMLLLVLTVGAVIGFMLGMCCIYVVVSCLKRRSISHCGKKSTQLCKQDRPAPLEPDYHYKYVPGMNRQNDPLLQNNHTFIDPHTRMVYGKYNSRKDDMYGGGDAGNGTIRMNALKDNHIYNTLEPRPDVLGSDTNLPPIVSECNDV